jgi:hypothetical protein
MSHRKYRVEVARVFDDGSETMIAQVTDYGWYVSPLLKTLARQCHEPAPVIPVVGQLKLVDDDAT